MKDKIKHEMYFDYLRIVAIFCVVGIHIVSDSWSTINTTSTSWQILNIFDSIFRFSVPIFIMISGALFLNKDKEISIKKLYSKNILRIFVSLIFWGLFYAIFRNLIKPNDTINLFNSIINDFFKTQGHLWFLVMLVGLYMAIPILRKICEDKKTEEYFLLLSLIFTFTFPFLLNVPKLSFYFQNSIIGFAVPVVSGYSGYFVLGHYLNTYEISKKKEKIIYVLGIISVIFTIIATYLFSLYKGYASEAFYNYLLINNLLSAVAVFILFKNHVSKIKISDKTNTKIQKLSKLTFGIYLIHQTFIILATTYNILTPSIVNSLLTPFYTLVVFMLSLICSYIISKIPFVNKYII